MVHRIEGRPSMRLQMSFEPGPGERAMPSLAFTGQAVVNAANVPVKTGRLKDTLRAGKGRTKAVVRMGGARVPYAGVIEYGWAARGITGSMAVNKARDSRKAESQRMIREGVDEILKNNNLI